MRRVPSSLVFALAVASTPLGAQPADFHARVDSIFSKWSSTTPGCAVGVARDGRVLLTKGYGMADLEHDVPLGADAVLETGSVAKQFTAAALALLQLEGKLSLDDDVRRYLPEVPAFGGQVITIRHMLTHTSGLRDQWGLLTLTGNPPTTQVHTLPLILHLVSRQQDLNFPVGSRYLYSNTGYALAAMVVQRVTGQSLAQFSRERFFGPLGMTRTQWHDDFQRIVPGHATAYQRRPDGTYAELMSFTNVYGNGGLLTTVGDMLRWNEALTTGTIPGGRALVDLLETRQRLTGGQTIAYALGLTHGTWRGRRQVSHGGSTAGYQTYLTRFPDDGVSIAVFCNTTDGGPTPAALQVAALLLPPATTTATAAHPPADTAVLRPLGGRYRNAENDDLADVFVRAEGLVARSAGGNGVLENLGGSVFRAGNGARFEFSRAGGSRQVRITDADGVTGTYLELAPPNAMTLRLADYTGDFESPELGVRYGVRLAGDQLELRFPPQPSARLTPLYADGFSAGGRTIRFVRDAAGRVTEFRVYAGRVLGVRFVRVAGS